VIEVFGDELAGSDAHPRSGSSACRRRPWSAARGGPCLGFRAFRSRCQAPAGPDRWRS
jgi:hypothetical protein